MNIFVTGATGNIGIELLGQLASDSQDHAIFAGVRNLSRACATLPQRPGIAFRKFDFEDASTHLPAFEGIDIVFLLRPPHISRINRVFEPLLANLRLAGVKRVVFLSVQGAETSTAIPHRKIELLILEHRLEHIFLRPSYFMQNLTTTLAPEIATHRTITLPAKDARFNWVDIRDIARLAAKCLVEFDSFRNRAMVVSGPQNLSFPEAVERINRIADPRIVYHSVNPIAFWRRMRALGHKPGLVVVMFLLHFLPRIQGEPEISSTYVDVFHQTPGSLEKFLQDHRDFFRPTNLPTGANSPGAQSDAGATGSGPFAP